MLTAVAVSIAIAQNFTDLGESMTKIKMRGVRLVVVALTALLGAETLGVAPASASFGAETLGVVPAGASCIGCYASFGLYAYSNDDVTGRRRNVSGEIIDNQDFHGALIDDSSGDCDYGGTQVRTLAKSYSNTGTTPNWGTARKSSGADDWWRWAGGHHWNDDGTNYNIWVADTCQKASQMASA